MVTYLMVAFGGALGSVARFGISNLIAQRYSGNFPIATLIVNVTGFFAIGCLASSTNSESARAFLMIGICGGYTTFSAFSLQNLQLIQSGHYLSAALNTILSSPFAWALYGLAFSPGSNQLLFFRVPRYSTKSTRSCCDIACCNPAGISDKFDFVRFATSVFLYFVEMPVCDFITISSADSLAIMPATSSPSFNSNCHPSKPKEIPELGSKMDS